METPNNSMLGVFFSSMIRVCNKVNSWGHLGWLLLPVYFILHGWQYYSEILSIQDVIEATSIVVLAMWLVWLLSFILLKYKDRRSLLTIIIGFFLLFTTPVIGAIGGTKYLPKLQHQIVFILIFIFLIFLLLRFVKVSVHKLNQFINAFLLFLILISVIQLVYKLTIRESDNQTEPYGLKGITTIKKRPSVYLIVLDEYAGNETLHSNFAYSNQPFLNFLESRKLKVIKSASSNYNYTMLSIPSMLNGSYIQAKGSESVYGEDGSKNALVTMYKNNSFRILRQNNYQIKNYSAFAVKGYPAAYNNRFLPGGRLLLLYPSLLDDFYEQLPGYLLARIGKERLINKYYREKNAYQERLLEKTLRDARATNGNPLFCYLHLMLPHSPYIYKSNGSINTDYLLLASPEPEKQRQAYLQQLAYTNRKIGEFTDSLLKVTRGEAIVMLMSDHGYKPNISGKKEDKFNSLNAVYLPEGMRDVWYDGMSNVNQFRLLFSILTQQDIQILKDSLVH